MEKETRQRQKKINGDVMPTNCDVIVIFPIYGQLEAIQKPNSGHIVCKTLSVIFHLTETEHRTKNL